MTEDRVQRYAKEIALACGYVDPLRQHQIAARAAVDVADAEQAELRAEVDSVRRGDGAAARDLSNAFRRAAAAEAKVERVTALATELDTLAEPYSTGSMFFDDAPTTRLRARASIRRDVATAIRFALDGDA